MGGMFSARHIVFVDESHCAPTALYRKYGRSEKGQPAFKRTSFRTQTGPTTSNVASMSFRGIETATPLDINTADTLPSFIF